MKEEEKEAYEIGKDISSEENAVELDTSGQEDSEDSNKENATDRATENNREEDSKKQHGGLTEESEELEEISELFTQKEVQIDRGFVKMLSRLPIAMKILKFLVLTNGDYHRQQLMEKLNLGVGGATYNLKKLCDAGVIMRFIPVPINLRVRLYRVVNVEVARKILMRYHWLVAFKLSKTLPFNPITLKDLEKLSEFNSCREKYFLSFDEAVEALQLNHREIRAIYSEGYSNKGQLTGFQRLLVDKIGPLQKGE